MRTRLRIIDDHAECLYCAAEVSVEGAVPPADDDEAWKSIASEHLPSCEWVLTRAHRRYNIQAPELGI